MKIIENTNLTDTYGMLPTLWNISTGQPGTIGMSPSIFLLVIAFIDRFLQIISLLERMPIADMNTC